MISGNNDKWMKQRLGGGSGAFHIYFFYFLYTFYIEQAADHRHISDAERVELQIGISTAL